MIVGSSNTTYNFKSERIMSIEKSKTVFIRVKESATPYVVYNRVRHNATTRGQWYLGSSCHANRTFSIDETEKLLGVYLNVTPTNPSFQRTIDDYWNNINVLINPEGRKLEIGWIYKDEDSAKKCEAIKDDGTPVIPESEKYKFGRPINYADYILWRYCLVVSSVARNPQLANKSPKIKYYLLDKEEESKRKDQLFNIEMKAMAKLVEILTDKSTRKQVAIMLGIPVMGVAETDIAHDLREYATINPAIFLKTVEDKHLTEKCLIKSIVNQPGSPIMQPENSSIIMYKGSSVANSIDELSVVLKDDNHEQLLNEMQLYYKSKQN